MGIRLSLGIKEDLISSIFGYIEQFDEDFSAIKQEIMSIIVTLPENPEESISEFNVLYSHTQSHLSRVSSILIDVTDARFDWQVRRTNLSKLFDRSCKKLLATDENIKGLRNQALQEAKVREELSDYVEIIDSLDTILDSFDNVLDLIKIKQKELENVNLNLSRQQRVVETMIGLGFKASP